MTRLSAPRETGNPAPRPRLLGLVVRGRVVRTRTGESVLGARAGAAVAAAQRELTGREREADRREEGSGTGAGTASAGLAGVGVGGARALSCRWHLRPSWGRAAAGGTVRRAFLAGRVRRQVCGVRAGVPAGTGLRRSRGGGTGQSERQPSSRNGRVRPILARSPRVRPPEARAARRGRQLP